VRQTALALTVLVCGLLLPCVPGSAADAPSYGVGADSLATPFPGGRYIHVGSSRGDDYTRVKEGMRNAHPGDVIVVGGGTYSDEMLTLPAVPDAEKTSSNIARGTASAPIVLQAAPGETVTVTGRLQLKNADYWTVEGIHFGYSAASTGTGAVVQFLGGTGWRFVNNEVSHSQGWANLIVEPTDVTAPSTANSPHDYRIAGNCIHDADRPPAGASDRGKIHDVYLATSIWSTGGVIERNLIGDAPNGSAIKATASNNDDGSTRNLTVSHNTLVNTSSGLILGVRDRAVHADFNAIARQAASHTDIDAAVKTYRLASPGANGVRDTLISGFAQKRRNDANSPGDLGWSGNTYRSSVGLAGSVDGCDLRLTDPALSARYGAGATETVPATPLATLSVAVHTARATGARTGTVTVHAKVTRAGKPASGFIRLRRYSSTLATVKLPASGDITFTTTGVGRGTAPYAVEYLDTSTMPDVAANSRAYQLTVP
jgi:hypothetical protein